MRHDEQDRAETQVGSILSSMTVAVEQGMIVDKSLRDRLISIVVQNCEQHAELKPSIYKQAVPCDDCPFRRQGGARHSRSMMQSYIDYFCSWPGATFPCHKSVPKDDPRDVWSAWREGQVLCAGGLIFAVKQQWTNLIMMFGWLKHWYDPVHAYTEDTKALVFDSAEEMLATAVEETEEDHAEVT